MPEIFFERTLNFLLFWGIWLLVPLVVDFSTAVIHFTTIFIRAKREEEEPDELSYYPPVTIVVPVHNSADTLYKCLQSIADQSYPAHLIQVICINNGSCDNSFEVFQRFQCERKDIAGMWTSLERAGKSIALNAGMYSGQGVYLFNVDADAWLDKDAVLGMVRAFESDSDLVAATGTIRVDKALGKGSGLIDIINYCEVVEYMIAFDVGRRYQSLTNTIFTLSGAFSAFRRDVILQSFLYQERTISEDTDLTYNLRNAIKSTNGRIGCVPDSVAYVKPVESLGRLYSQRVRWQRGEIEVASIYYKKAPGPIKALFDFTGRLLITDHTFAFLRLAWTFLFPFLYLLGYSLSTVVVVMFGLFICYPLIDGGYFFIVYKSASRPYRKELKKIWWIVFLMPVYRFLTYWFRLSGIILGMAEGKSWRVENPVKQLADAIGGYKGALSKLLVSVKKR